MKVHESHGLIPNQIRKNKEVKGVEDKTFSQVMNEAGIEEGVRSQKGFPSSGIVPDGVLIIDKTQGVQPSAIPVEKERILKDLEETLDFIDFYAARLADGSFPADDMSSLVSHLEERMEGLRTLENDSGIPGKLKEIVSDTVLTIGRETAKFRRGDYT